MKIFRLWFAGLLVIGLIFSADSFGAAAEAPQSNSAGGVTMKVTYLNPGGADGPRFQVVLDTHSVNLDAYDLKSLTILRDDAGKSYAATRVENKGGGHHRETTVSFAKLDQDAKRIELVMKDVAGVKERVFSWKIE
jgi:hypothetical protein